ncbi:MAG: hypothetical protein AAB592_02780 [Patescibacteria group bacterium]
MHDIKIPDSSMPGERRGNPAGRGEFEVSEVHGADDGRPGESVKVKFGNFVQLVATHDVEEVLKKHENDDIVVSTNLLTDLANAHEEGDTHQSKLPVIFMIGIILGIVVTYVIIQF